MVVPFYDVEQYFATCLNSLIRQTYRNLEIILVDDGSPDGSLAIARSYRRWDRRIRIVRQVNQGLGAARNTGLAAATGRYVTFVDSDDVLPRMAISTMVRTLESTGSDFVVGGLRRFEQGVKAQTPPWVKQVHRAQRLRIRLDDHPDILRNVFAWNKLFDREFFVREVGGFPVGVRYEDQEATAKAYLRGTFDVLNVNVYLWRRRIEGTSITQQKTDPRDLADRLEVKGAVSKLMAAEASPAVFETWMAKALGFDLRPYLEQIPRTGEEFWLRLREGVLRFVEVASDDIWRQVSLVDRYPALCVRDDHRDDAIRFLTRRDEQGWCFPTERRDGVVSLDSTYLDGMTFQPKPELLALAAADLRWTQSWRRGSGSRASWSCRVTRSSPTSPSMMADGVIEVTASAGSRRVPLVVERLPGDHIDRSANDGWNTHRGAGFEATVDVAALRAAGLDSVWTIRIQVRIGEVAKSGTFVTRDFRIIAGAAPVAADDGAGRWIVHFDKGHGVQLRYRPRSTEIVVDEVVVDGEHVSVIGGPGLVAVRAAAKSPSRTVDSQPIGETVDGRRAVTLRLPPSADRPHGRTTWDLRVVDGGRLALPIPPPGDDLHQPVRAYSGPSGLVRLRQISWSVVVDQVERSSSRLVLRGRTSAPTPGEAVLVSTRGQLRAPAPSGPVRTSSRLCSTSRRPHPSTSERATTCRSPPTLRAYPHRAGRNRHPRWWPPIHWTSSPAIMRSRSHLSREGLFRIRFRQPFLPNERGRLAQHRLQSTFTRPADLVDAVVFESFAGKNIADSPKAICAELLKRGSDLELFWTVDDLTRPVPEGATPCCSTHAAGWRRSIAPGTWSTTTTSPSTSASSPNRSTCRPGTARR